MASTTGTEARASSSATYSFPPDFLWGAATSSHQTEGDNRFSDWWEYECDGRVPQRSGAACQHYRLFRSDFDFARASGHNAHRLSIEWSRLEPVEGEWDDRELVHYRDVLGALRDRNIEPIVTLHHFTAPAWFTRAGGWSRRSSVALFARYVEFVALNLGSDARYWITINEPTVYVRRGFVTGDWPPCRRSDWSGAARVLYNLARAHVAAFRILHEERPECRVGFAHSAPFIVACDPGSSGDRAVAWLRDVMLNRAFFALIRVAARGRHPGRTLDFLGINYYNRTIVRRSGRGLGAVFGRECRLDHHGSPRRFSSLGWEIYPAGLLEVLQRYRALGVPMMVTENGIATDDEALRTAFLIEHIASVGRAVAMGLDVIGYLYWTLMDNFEWTLGSEAHFGLAAVDERTQERLPRPAARRFAPICATNTLRVAPEDAPHSDRGLG